MQPGFGGSYNANSTRLNLPEVMHKHGQAAVDELIRDLELEAIFGFRPGPVFRGGMALDA